MTDLSDPDDLNRWMATAMQLFRSITGTLSDMLARARAEEPGALADLLKKQAELEAMLGRALVMEARLHEHRSKTTRDGSAGDIDFDILRDQIGRRLDRLRAAGGAAGLS